jgi:ParB family chromosome partitioning protein
LIPIENGDKQYHTACKIFDEKLSVRETEKLVKHILNEKSYKEIAVTQEDDFIFRNLEDKIRSIVGTKVSIHKKNSNKGSIEIEYYSSEELERIVDMFETMN